MWQSILHNVKGLSIFAIVTAGLIALTQTQTADTIAANERAARAKALYEIIAKDNIDNDLLEDTISITSASLGIHEPQDVYIAKRDGKAVAAILPVVAPDGYTGSIKLIVGIHSNGDIAGVRVLNHQETPGLGDKIDLKKSPWVLSFNDKSLLNPAEKGWRVKKDGGDFDQFTGATITPRAIVSAVHRALRYFESNKVELLAHDQENKS